MSTFILSSSFIIGLSLSQSATWSDDGRNSFDADLGWAFYDKNTPTVDRCLNNANCQQEDTTTTPTTYYHGPISNEYLILKRRFECPYKADVSLQYKVAACDVPGTANKDFTRSEVEGSQASKVTMASSTILSTSLLDTTECSSNYYTQTVTATNTNWNVLKNERFEVKIKAKVLGGSVSTAYIYDIKITCDEITTTTIPPGTPTSSPTPKPSTSMSDLEFCIDGFTGDDAIYNGEYILMDVQINGENAYEKNDYQANSFFYYSSSEWYFSTVSGSTDTDDIIATRGCDTPAPTAANDACDSGEACECVIDSNGDPISLVWIDGECENAHVTVSNVFGGLFELNQETETLFMLITLCFVSFIAGMFTCACCRLVFNNKKKSDKEREYEKVSVKDADIEFSN